MGRADNSYNARPAPRVRFNPQTTRINNHHLPPQPSQEKMVRTIHSADRRESSPTLNVVQDEDGTQGDGSTTEVYFDVEVFMNSYSEEEDTTQREDGKMWCEVSQDNEETLEAQYNEILGPDQAENGQIEKKENPTTTRSTNEWIWEKFEELMERDYPTRQGNGEFVDSHVESAPGSLPLRLPDGKYYPDNQRKERSMNFDGELERFLGIDPGFEKYLENEGNQVETFDGETGYEKFGIQQEETNPTSDKNSHP